MDFNAAKKDIQRVSMTSQEKSAMVKAILHAPEVSASNTPVRSPYSFFKIVSSHKVFSSVVAALLVIVIGGSGMTLAAQGALPGNPLYAIKTNVIEPLKVDLASNPLVKAQIQVQLAQTRLNEAETLAVQGQLDPAKQEQLTVLLKDTTTAVDQSLAQVRVESPQEANDVATNFNVSLNAHANALETLSGSNTDQTISAEARSAAQTFAVSGAPVAVMRSATFSPAAAASTSTPVSNQSKSRQSHASEYTSRREKIKSLIQTASTSLQSTVASSTQTSVIIQHAEDAVNQANQALQRADNDNSGGTTSPNDALIQSQTSAEEANILINVESHINDNGNNGHKNQSSAAINSHIKGSDEQDSNYSPSDFSTTTSSNGQSHGHGKGNRD